MDASKMTADQTLKPKMPTSHNGTESFSELGWASTGAILDPQSCYSLREWIDGRRPIDRSIFYSSEGAFNQKGRWTNYAPGRSDHNLLISPEVDLTFIENNSEFKRFATELAGEDYSIMKKSVIRSVPHSVLPDWITDYVSEVGRPNLNPFVKDEFQDVQYFLSTDFHQDKTRPNSNFVTVYIYLDKVDEKDSALHLLSGSHKLGMTHYPHLLRRSHLNTKVWYYSDFNGNHETCNEKTLVGQVGTVFSFHCLTLHGTGLNDSPNPRISLRYLLSKSPETKTECLLDKANRKVYGPHQISNARLDISVDGSFSRTGSSLLSYIQSSDHYKSS